MEINKYLYSKAFDKALKVEFLTNREELFLYAGALYSAMMWSREVNEKNRVILKKNKYVKYEIVESVCTIKINFFRDFINKK